MKLKFFTIPIYDDGRQESELNSFLSGRRIVSVDKHLVQAGANSAWSFCVAWTDVTEKAPVRKGKIDYKELLNEQEFRVYAMLRERRKQLAEAEGVPAYAIFTNEQLADMVRQRVQSKAQLSQIKGIGAARVDKYGEQFLDVLSAEHLPAPESADGEAV